MSCSSPAASASRARTADELLFRDELGDIARRRGGRVTYLLGHDRDALSAHALRVDIPGLPASQLHEERFSC